MPTCRKLAMFSDDQELHANVPMDERLLRLIGKPRPRIGYVPEAAYPDRVSFDRKRDYYAQMGADLAVYFDEQTADSGRSALFECDAIHLSGGNTFSFLYWLKKRQMADSLRRYVFDGGVLVGVSAGSILMTPNVQSASLCGDPEDARLEDYSALTLVDFHFWPHFDPERPLTPTEKNFIASRPKTYACAGGSGIIVDDDTIELFGLVQGSWPVSLAIA
jgi:dipeptidase E